MRPRRAAATVALTAAAAGLAWLLFAGLPRWYSAPAGGDARVRRRGGQLGPKDQGAIVLCLGRRHEAHKRRARRAVRRGNRRAGQSHPQRADCAGGRAVGVGGPAGHHAARAVRDAAGEAYVDLSRELTRAHPGGSLNELLTIYTLVDALTVNLPAISSVQLLVDGKEVDTLAGHVDVRRPLLKNLDWIQ